MKILITGANRGIGLAFCQQYGARGDEVLAICRKSSDGLDQLARETGSSVRIIDGIDVTSDEQISALVQAVGPEKIDVLINNAGIMSSVTLDNLGSRVDHNAV